MDRTACSTSGSRGDIVVCYGQLKNEQQVGRKDRGDRREGIGRIGEERRVGERSSEKDDKP